mmetsp:Transcript_10528/g.20912  ORF Transcript_10528/g.20912 Transcript_10528/m.20912 type:complete len:201 (-) Transcript_10528:1193-1795(-)
MHYAPRITHYALRTLLMALSGSLPVERKGLVDEVVGADVLRVELAPQRVEQADGVPSRQPRLIRFQSLRITGHFDLSPVRVDVGRELCAHLPDELCVVPKLVLDSPADSRVRHGQVHDHPHPREDVVDTGTGGGAHAALRRPRPALLDRRRGGEARSLYVFQEVHHETDVCRGRFHLSPLSFYRGCEVVDSPCGVAHLEH